MEKRDLDLKQKYDSFVNDYNNIGKSIDEINPIFSKFMDSVAKETMLIANIEKYCGFLKIEEANTDAKNQDEVDSFKKQLLTSKQMLDDIVTVLNECKNGIKISNNYLSEISSELKNSINDHLTKINSSIQSTNSYLNGFVAKEEPIVSDNKEEKEVPINDLNDGNKVVNIEDKPKDMNHDEVVSESIDDLTSLLDKDIEDNTNSINDLKATSEAINNSQDSEQIENFDNVAPFNFDQMNLSNESTIPEINVNSNDDEENIDGSLDEFFSENKPNEEVKTDDTVKPGDGFIKVTDVQAVGAPEKTSTDEKNMSLDLVR
jgi:hypothetical protein